MAALRRTRRPLARPARSARVPCPRARHARLQRSQQPNRRTADCLRLPHETRTQDASRGGAAAAVCALRADDSPPPCRARAAYKLALLTPDEERQVRKELRVARAVDEHPCVLRPIVAFEEGPALYLVQVRLALDRARASRRAPPSAAGPSLLAWPGCCCLVRGSHRRARAASRAGLRRPGRPV